MKKIFAVAGLLLTVTVACGKQTESPDAAATPAAPVATEAAPAPAPATGQAPAAAPEESAGIDAGEAVAIEGEEQDAPATTRANVQLAQAIAPAAAPAQSSRFSQGQHYKLLVPTQPTNVSPDKVEVVEMFWYGCPHCRDLEPFLENWDKKKPAYVQLTRLPVTWGPVHKAHARLFYTLAALGKAQELHDKVFDEIQIKGNQLFAGSDDDTLAAQAAFAARNGINAQEFKNTYRSMGVGTHLSRAEQLARNYQVTGVPYFIINGKYTTDVSSAGGHDQLFALISELAAREQKKQ